jgi:hypothetical protein
VACHARTAACCCGSIFNGREGSAHLCSSDQRNPVGPDTPSEKSQKGIESNDIGVAMEGIIGKLVESRFPNDVVGVGSPVPDPTKPGSLLTDIDIQLKYAVVEIKTGRYPVNLKQLGRQRGLGLPVLVYAPQATANQERDLVRAGANVFRDLNSLLRALNQLAEAESRKLPTILRRP